MKIFKTRSVSKEANKSKLKDRLLAKAVEKANEGLVDAQLGAHLYKQRVGRKGDFRIILFLVVNWRCVLLELYPKNFQSNIEYDELEAVRDFANIVASISDDEFLKLAETSGWKEISHEPPEEDV